MANNQASLPISGSGIPKKAATAMPLKPVGTAEQESPTRVIKPHIFDALDQSDGFIVNSSGQKDPKKRLSRMIPIVVASKALPSISETSSRSASQCDSTRASEVTSSSSSTAQSISTASSVSCGPVSLYNGPQVAEPCVRNALLHVLQPCGHRVMTSTPEPCGSNCKGSDWVFANTKTEDKFVCVICISRYVREHYQEKKALFLPSLDALENALGGFKAGWKEARIARMERIWKNDALEEQMALETLGRFCQAIATEPDEEGEALFTIKRDVLATKDPVETVPLTNPADPEKDRLNTPVWKPMAMRKSQLPAPSTSSKKPVDQKTVERGRGREKTSRLPVGRPSRK
ncbi:hypothetical protein Q7P37_010534 [Cladosporium fusiforme]